MMAETVLGGVGFREEFSFLLKRTKASSRFSVNREYIGIKQSTIR